MPNSHIYEKDEFWFTNPAILLQRNRMLEFYPSSEMTFTEKLNAGVRFSIYLSILLFVATLNYLYFYIPLIALLITYAFYTVTSKTEPFKDTLFDKVTTKCQKPSYNNPFMNVLVTDYKYNPNKQPACNVKDDPKIKEEIENKFNFNLYQNVDDVYGNQNSQRQYFTMPWTTIPNDQGGFAKWLYNLPKTLKESTICDEFRTNQNCDERFTRLGTIELNGYDPSL